MANLQLSVAVGNYDRCRPLFDGEVQIDGVDPVFMMLSPEEIFFRAFRNAEFDICELSLSSSTVKISQNDLPYVCVPVFLSRMFRHSAVYVRKDRIKRPQDLKNKKVGLPEYQLTANVWVRAFLNDDFGVGSEDITWVRGGISEPDRTEKITLDLPKSIRLENAPLGKTISALLAEGEIDGFIAPRAPEISLREIQEHRMAVRRSPGSGHRILSQIKDLSDHAYSRRAARIGGTSPVAAESGLQGVL